MMHELRQAVLHAEQRDLHLDRAAAWHVRWKRHAPEETRTRIYPDVIEGTAQYFDEAASVRAHVGPDATRDQIDAAYRYVDDTLTLAKVPVSRQVTDEEGRVILCGPSMFGAQP
jgi:hypothetical protein